MTARNAKASLGSFCRLPWLWPAPWWWLSALVIGVGIDAARWAS